MVYGAIIAIAIETHFGWCVSVSAVVLLALLLITRVEEERARMARFFLIKNGTSFGPRL